MKSSLLDVLVVGAGPAGTWVADHLQACGRQVTMLDAGPWPGRNGEVPPIDEEAWRYKVVDAQASWLRVRAVGGASLVWGGWCNRFTRQVFETGDWPCTLEDLAPAYDEVEARIGVRTRPLAPGLQSALQPLRLGLRPQRLAAAEPGGAWTARKLPASARTVASTAALRLELNDDEDAAASVVAVDGRGEIKRYSARAFVIAASPIESARLLMEHRAAMRWPGLGRGLVLHPVQGYALVSRKLPDWGIDGATAAFVPRFVNLDAHEGRPYRGGFGIEIQGPMAFSQLADHLRERLSMQGSLPEGAQITLIHAMGETFPHSGRWMDLDPVERDTLGRRIPRIRLGWSESERHMAADMQTACCRIAETLACDGDHLLHYLDSIRTPMLFHEAGTCAMGPGVNAVCGATGEVRGLRNVWVADASALPGPGDCHPTLTILAHAARCARSLERHLTSH